MIATNRLPKTWFIKKDYSNPNWDKVQFWITVTYQRSSHNLLTYCGVDGSLNNDDMVCHDFIENFKNNPPFLDLETFIELIHEGGSPFEYKNRLPKYWVAYADKSNPNMQKLYDYRNSRDSGYRWPYIGIEDGNLIYGCTEDHSKQGNMPFKMDLYIESFSSKVIVLTIDQFIELSKDLIN